MPNNSSPPSSELIAIEPPDFLTSITLKTGEFTGIEWLLFAGLVALIGLMGVWVWRNRLYVPIYLYWKLRCITPKNNPAIPRQWAYLLYQYQLTIQLLSPPTFEQPTLSLMEQLQPLCFAKEEVSRETYQRVLRHTKQQLKLLFKHLLTHKPNKETL